MFSVKFLIGAAAAAMLSTTAFAADMPQPQPVYQPVVAEPCCSSAWYLRGDVGIGITNTFNLTYLPSPPDVGNGFAIRSAFGGGHDLLRCRRRLRGQQLAALRRHRRHIATERKSMPAASSIRPPATAMPIKAI